VLRELIVNVTVATTDAFAVSACRLKTCFVPAPVVTSITTSATLIALATELALNQLTKAEPP
jgi:hypothetical protein